MLCSLIGAIMLSISIRIGLNIICVNYMHIKYYVSTSLHYWTFFLKDNINYICTLRVNSDGRLQSLLTTTK